jgi:hypothetical protein
MKRLFLALLTLACVHLAAARSAVLVATAANVQTQIGVAKDGDVIQAVGQLPPKVTIYNQHHVAPVTLDLTQATLPWLFVANSGGWNIIGDGHGGGVVGAGTPYDAIQVSGSDHLAFSGLTLAGYGAKGGAGIGLLDSHNVTVHDNVFRDAPGDGIDVVSSQDVSIYGDRCLWLAYGTVLHADCVQIWNKPGDPSSVARVYVDHMTCIGDEQCITAFGNGDPRPLVDVEITDNDAAIGIQWAGSIDKGNVCQGCVKLRNHAQALSGYPANWAKVGWYAGDTPAPGNTNAR